MSSPTPLHDYETLDPTDWDEARQSAHRMIDDMVDYMSSVRERPAWQTVPAEVRQSIAEDLPRAGKSLDEVYDQFQRDILPYPTGNLHPGFFGWVMGNGSLTGALADALASTMNAHVAGYDQSAAFVERQVISWLSALVGYPKDASGLLVTGGTMANLNGLAVARNEKAGFDVRAHGVAGESLPKLRVYGSKETHSWIYKACELMGMGHDAFRAIPVNVDYQIDVEACRNQIEQDIANGDKPFCVIGTAGTVNTAAVDDFHALRALADEFNIWFHIDGAFGTLAAWSPDTAERIRDKIAASKAKGLWMGGRIPTGYDADGRTLKVNEAEAVTIRRLFDLYIELGDVTKVVEEAEREELRTKRYQAKTGKMLGGRPFTRGLVYRILNNAIYIGRIPHKDTSYPGQHQAIVDPLTWEKVHEKLAAANRTKGGRNVAGILSGRLFDEDGVAMTRHTAKPRGKVYTYYLSGETSPHDWRIRAADIEGCVFWAARQIMAGIRPGDVDDLASRSQIKSFEAAREELQKRSRAKTLDLVEAITLGNTDIEVRLYQAAIEEAIGCKLQSARVLQSRFDIELIKRKHELKLAYDTAITHPDVTLQQALLKAIRWKARLINGETMTDIAKADELSVQSPRAGCVWRCSHPQSKWPSPTARSRPR